MAGRGQNGNTRDETPPPLLLMPTGGGLTMDANSGVNLLLPVTQNEPSLLSEMEAEADSFLGQTPPDSANATQPQPAPFTFFQQQSTTASDPFSQVGYKPHPPSAPPSQGPPPISHAPQQRPPASSTPPQMQPVQTVGGPPQAPIGFEMSALGPSSGGPPPMTNAPPMGPAQGFRRQGGPRYAPPPPGTYANTAPPPGQYPPGPPAGQVYPPTSQFPVESPYAAEDPPPYTPEDGSYQQPQIHPPTSAMTAVNQAMYRPVQHHWFYVKKVEGHDVWTPFSVLDSMKVEEAWCAAQLGKKSGLIATDGGRYDVQLHNRVRTAIYWDEDPSEVRRCSWFFKRESDGRFVPYTEDFSEKLEEEYRNAVLNQIWHKRLEFSGGETIVIHNPNVIVHFRASSLPDEFGTTTSDQYRPRVVKRGVEDFANIEDGEPTKIDHLVFVVHGIGPICDMRFRSIVECVDDFRAVSIQLLQSHFKPYLEEGRIGRVEFLPVYWYESLHGDATGVDRRLRAITLKSIPKLRHFTNSTLLDILFYSSPAYCQQIANTVGCEMNRLYDLFLERNPEFNGQASVAGHSLGSLIVFDLLAHQNYEQLPESREATPSSSTQEILSEQNSVSGLLPQTEEETAEETEKELTLEILLEKLSLSNFLEVFQKEQIDIDSLKMCDESDIKEMGLPMGPRKKILTFVKEQKQKEVEKKLEEEKKAQQEVENKLREEAEQRLREAGDAKLNQSSSQLIADPLMEAASSSEISFIQGLAGTGQLLVQYPKLDFDITNFFALGSPIAMFLTVRGIHTVKEDYKLPSCQGVFNVFHPFDPVAYRLEPLIDPNVKQKPVLLPHHKGRKRLHLELKDSLTRMGADLKQRIVDSVKSTWNTLNAFAQAHRQPAQEEVEKEVNNIIQEMAEKEAEAAETESVQSLGSEENLKLGQLNQGRRIDYVLQEKPIESFNDYLFALASHACYWESEDTVLFILKETYALIGIAPVQQGSVDSPRPVKFGPPLVSGFLPHTGQAPPVRPPTMSNQPTGLPPMGQGYQTGPPPMGQRAPVMGQAPPHPMTSQAPQITGPPPMSGFVRK